MSLRVPLKRVVLATSYDSSYEFLAPITCLLFKQVAGYLPTLLLVNDEAEWEQRPSGKLVVEMAKAAGADVHYIGRIEGYRIGVNAQAARQHAACLPYPDDDYLMTADVDMWPVNGAWFNQQDWHKELHFWYANAYAYRFHTTGYIGMRAGLWRRIMGIYPRQPINEALQFALDRHVTRDYDTMQEWYFDERYTSARIKAWDGYPEHCQMIEREGAPPVDRIDRSGWPDDPKLEGKVDAHVLRPGYINENWPKLVKLLCKLLPPSLVHWCDAYRNSYKEVV